MWLQQLKTGSKEGENFTNPAGAEDLQVPACQVPATKQHKHKGTYLADALRVAARSSQHAASKVRLETCKKLGVREPGVADTTRSTNGNAGNEQGSNRHTYLVPFDAVCWQKLSQHSS
jgi:hypothetical protein